MRILLVSFYFHPELGSAPSRITNMAKGFKGLGAEVDVLTCLPNYPEGRIFEKYRGNIYKREKIDECNVYRYWTYATVSKNPILRGISIISFSVMMWLFAFKIRLIKSYSCVIIQSPPLPVAGSAIALFKCLYRKRTILNVSDLWPLSAVELGAMRQESRMYRWFSRIEKFNYRKADAILGQSEEILSHIAHFESPSHRFLYRNFQKYDIDIDFRRRNQRIKIVYAGLLGVAQDILEIIKNIDFKQLGIEFHLYGGGNQTKEIETYISEKDCNVFYHGFVSKEKIVEELSQYDASIIPLTVRIQGAVPSKLFDISPMGIPVLFCGGGEGADIVKQHEIGFVSPPGDYPSLAQNIGKLASMTDEEYIALSTNCVNVGRTFFNFEKQMQECNSFIENVWADDGAIRQPR